jgi:hypothetical protein
MQHVERDGTDEVTAETPRGAHRYIVWARGLLSSFSKELADPLSNFDHAGDASTVLVTRGFTRAAEALDRQNFRTGMTSAPP